MLSKNNFLGMTIFMMCCFVIQTQASSYGKVKKTMLKRTLLGLPIILTGPCITAASVSKLKLARQLKHFNECIIGNAANTGLRFDLARKASHLQMRGRIGLVVGTTLSTPLPLILKRAYDEDQTQSAQ